MECVNGRDKITGLCNPSNLVPGDTGTDNDRPQSTDYFTWMKDLFSPQAVTSNKWKNEPESGLFDIGTRSDWDLGLGAFDSLMGIADYTLAKKSFKELQDQNRIKTRIAQDNSNLNHAAADLTMRQAQNRNEAILDFEKYQGKTLAENPELFQSYAAIRDYRLPEQVALT